MHLTRRIWWITTRKYIKVQNGNPAPSRSQTGPAVSASFLRQRQHPFDYCHCQLRLGAISYKLPGGLPAPIPTITLLARQSPGGGTEMYARPPMAGINQQRSCLVPQGRRPQIEHGPPSRPGALPAPWPPPDTCEEQKQNKWRSVGGATKHAGLYCPPPPPPTCFQQYAPAKNGLNPADGLKAHSRRPINLSIPFVFNTPNTNNNHGRIRPLTIPGRFSRVPLFRSKTFPTKSRSRASSVTDFWLITRPTRCNLCGARRTALRTKRVVSTSKMSSR